MKAYTVHAPPGEAAPERFVFIKDGFCWPAFFLQIVWILWHRLWLVLLVYLAAMLVIVGVERLIEPQIASVLAVLGNIWFAAEANNLRRWSLARKGWRELGPAQGASLQEAEIGFFAKTGGKADVPVQGRSPDRRGQDWSDEGPGHGGHDGPIFGLFPEPER